MSDLASTYQRSRIPLYVQLANTLRRRIEDGQWEPSQKISTLEELEKEFQVARVTVRQAVDLLHKEGLVHRQQGRGTFVAERIRDKRWLKLETTWPALIATIRDNLPRMIPVRNPPAQPRLREEDGRLGARLPIPAQPAVPAERAIRGGQPASRPRTSTSAIPTPSRSTRRCQFSPRSVTSRSPRRTRR